MCKMYKLDKGGIFYEKGITKRNSGRCSRRESC